MARKMTREAARQFYKILSEGRPSPQTELNYSSPYTLLVAVVLSAQATDIGVNKATQKLFPVADTPEKMVALGVEAVGEYVRTIGLWRNKAKNVIALSQRLIDEFDSQVPESRDVLETLPGVGRKTANVVCNVVFGQPTIAVDTHLFRIGNRTRIAPGKTPLEVERGLERITPDEYLKDAHHWLILHGRYICKARTPECWRCTVREVCLYKDKTPSVDDAPKVPKKTTTKKAKAVKSKSVKKKAVKNKIKPASAKKTTSAKKIGRRKAKPSK